MGVSSMSCSNMVLFDAEDKIKKFDNVEQILQEFYDNRLKAYAMRKKALLTAMEHTLLKISNQARFILMIVEGKLKISKRKRMDVVKDLRHHKFDIWLAAKDSANTLRNRAKATDAFEEEDDAKEEEKQRNANAMDVDAGGSDADLKKYSQGYKYLLSMSLSSLTMEKVEELLKEVNDLKQKTVKDLWRDDLDELDVHMEEYERSYEESVQVQRQEAAKKRKLALSKNKNTKKTTRKKTTKGNAKKSKSNSKESSLNAGFEKLFNKKTKKATPKKKKKLLSSTKGSNELPSDPFSIAKSKKKPKFVDSDDDDSESPNAGLSLFERARLKRDSPQKGTENMRKRKRDIENLSDSDSGLEELEPPRKKNKSSSVSTSGSSSATLKSLPMNDNTKVKKKTKKKKRAIMSDSDEDFGNESEEYRPPQDDSDDDFDIVEDDTSNNSNENRRVLRRKATKQSYKEKSASTAYSNGDDGESDYNLSEDLEIDEFDDDDDYDDSDY